MAGRSFCFRRTLQLQIDIGNCILHWNLTTVTNSNEEVRIILGELGVDTKIFYFGGASIKNLCDGVIAGRVHCALKGQGVAASSRRARGTTSLGGSGPQHRIQQRGTIPFPAHIHKGKEQRKPKA